jgi:hypothetical protein
MRYAAELSANDVKTAIAAYRHVADDTSVAPLLRELATLRAAAMLIDQRESEEVRKLLEPMAQPGGHYRHSARELLALSAWRSRDATALKRWLDVIVKDPQTPLAMRSRISMLVALSAEQSKT